MAISTPFTYNSKRSATSQPSRSASLANDIPIEGHPKDTHAVFSEYSRKLTESEIPKLLIHFKPGFVIKAAELEWAKKNLKNLTLAEVGNSVHFVQEDDPHGIGEAIADWYQNLKP